MALKINDYFGVVNNQFINIYTKDNPILNIGDSCYFLFHNISDFHKLLIGKGIICEDSINDGMHKTYYVKLEEIIETPDVINKFVYEKQFILTRYAGSANSDIKKITGNRVHIITNKTSLSFLNTNLFEVNGFFIRNTLELIKGLKSEFTNIIMEDLKQQLSDLEN
jgi:hypothetical protein